MSQSHDGYSGCKVWHIDAAVSKVALLKPKWKYWKCYTKVHTGIVRGHACNHANAGRTLRT